MTGLHGYLSKLRKDFAADANKHSAKFYRILNEVPTLLMIGIVILPWSNRSDRAKNAFMKVRLALFLVSLSLLAARLTSTKRGRPCRLQGRHQGQPAEHAAAAKKTASRKNLDGLFDSFGDHDLVSPYYLHGVEISDPQPGRLEFIPGWRVCLRASVRLNPVIRSGDEVAHVQPVYSDPKNMGVFLRQRATGQDRQGRFDLRPLHLYQLARTQRCRRQAVRPDPASEMGIRHALRLFDTGRAILCQPAQQKSL